MEQNITACMKHIDIAHHFLHDLVKSHDQDHLYTDMREPSRCLKGLPKLLHQDLTTGIGVISDQGGVLE